MSLHWSSYMCDIFTYRQTQLVSRISRIN